ncbi:hypothetical protein EBB07_09445 [Paenibacillaceae bacterium]|nr:hypothetical protein EBB07_09445 [Paenibacillaceae bacterium]
MSTVLKTRNVYEDFDIQTDILFFNVGAPGLISFHGRNYNIKKRIAAGEFSKLIANPGFMQIKPDCYVNLDKILSIENDHIYFGLKHDLSKAIPVSKRKQQIIKEIMAARKP